MRIIITAGDGYTDIDVLACTVAYQQLLSLLSKSSQVVLTGELNESITPLIRNLDFKYQREYDPQPDDSFVIMDISDFAHISNIVDQTKIIKLFDHHFGFEKYWQAKLGENCHIEHIGACATLIWEEFINMQKQDQIDETSAKLLYTAIVSNTLNFKAKVTSQRDMVAAKQIKELAKIGDDWIVKYYQEIEEQLIKGLNQLLPNTINDSNINHKIYTLGQIELWNAQNILKNFSKQLIQSLSSHTADYKVFSIVSISEDKNYLLTDDLNSQEFFEALLHVKFKNNIAETSKLILRKEMKKLLMTFKI